MKWIGKKKRRILMGFLNQNFASFFLKFHELLFRSKDEEEERKEGRKETERIYVCVCLPYVLCIVVFLLNRTPRVVVRTLSLVSLSPPSRSRRLFFGRGDEGPVDAHLLVEHQLPVHVLDRA